MVKRALIRVLIYIPIMSVWLYFSGGELNALNITIFTLVFFAALLIVEYVIAKWSKR